MDLFSTGTLSDADVERFHDDGFFVLTRSLSPRHLEVLRRVCERSVTEFEVEDDHEACRAPLSEAPQGENQTHKRYRIRNRFEEPAMAEVIFGDIFASICRATLGDTAYLLSDQFLIVGPGRQETFGWRQPSWGFKTVHRRFITCVVAMDDVTAANCALSLLPYSQAGTRDLVRSEEGYRGPEQGIPIVVPAGAIVVFSSSVFYRLRSNTSGNWRRAYVSQYSPEPLKNSDGTLANLAVPFLARGERKVPVR